eukprot:5532179-Prymnesium_polylepis.1
MLPLARAALVSEIVAVRPACGASVMPRVLSRTRRAHAREPVSLTAPKGAPRQSGGQGTGSSRCQGWGGNVQTDVKP